MRFNAAHMKKIRILKRDFDAACKQPWANNTCILSQATMRNGLGIKPFLLADNSDAALKAMGVFDRSPKWKNETIAGEMPRPELKSMQKLRASLPITVILP